MIRGYASEATGGGALSSMEICQDIMACNKTLATAYTMAALESADPSVRRTFRQLGRDCERVAYRAFEILHTNGHYDVKSATPTEMRQVEDMLDSFLRGQAVPNAEPSRSPGSGWQRPAAVETQRTYAHNRTYSPERGFGAERAFDAERPFAGERSFGSERTYGADRTFGAERNYGADRPYGAERTFQPDRPLGTDRPVAPGTSPYGSERSPSYGEARTERSQLPDWARARV